MVEGAVHGQDARGAAARGWAEQEPPGSPMGRLATELKPLTDSLNIPRSSVLSLLGELRDRGALRLDPPEADLVPPAEIVVVLERAGLRIVRA